MVMRSCEPNVVEVRTGWLATVPPDYPYRIGVVGRDEAEARRRFVAELAAWSELHELVEAEKASN